MAMYFNKQNRNNHMILLMFWDIMTEWDKNCNVLTKQERKYLRMSTSLMLKVSDSIVQRFGKKYAETLMRDVRSFSLISKPTTSITDSDVTSSSMRLTSLDDIYDLAEVSLQDCAGCGGKKDCPNRDLYERVGIPATGDNDVVCPYQQ